MKRKLPDNQCKGLNKNGTRCRRGAGAGDFCPGHDPSPEAEEKRRAVSSKGGTAKNFQCDPGEVSHRLRSKDDVLKLSEAVVASVRAGVLPAHSAREITAILEKVVLRVLDEKEAAKSVDEVLGNMSLEELRQWAPPQ